MTHQVPLFGPDPGALSGASLSACGLYRYHLFRTWSDGPTVNFIMLNPSTADADHDDPTIRRCVGFARSWGFGTLAVTNLYALRATDPRELRESADPVGPDNDGFLRLFAGRADRVVCAWGNHGARGRGPAVRATLEAAGVELFALKVTGLGQPAHPLYLPADLKPFRWAVRRVKL